MAKSNPVSAARLREIFKYDPLTGAISWMRRPLSDFTNHSARGPEHDYKIWNSRYAEKPAFTTKNREGRASCRLNGIRVDASRVAYALHHGEWPNQVVDHINGDVSDNRSENLRQVTFADNMRNAKRRSDNKSGVTGVRRRRGKWVAEICHNGTRSMIGKYDSIEDAAAARKDAERRLGFHENHGRSIVGGNGEKNDR